MLLKLTDTNADDVARDLLLRSGDDGGRPAVVSNLGHELAGAECP
jgi:hypothetical protein